MITKILVSIGSISTIAFGVWHFFVPGKYNWYFYISKEAVELVTAIRAINIFFSLCLVLIGIANIIFIYADHRFAIWVMLLLTSILWATRVILQVIYPQGSINPMLQYGMLAAFIVSFLCFFIPLIIRSIRACF